MHTQRSCAPSRVVRSDVHNEVSPPRENNLNIRRHNSQHDLSESSTSSNGDAGGIITIPDSTVVRTSRPKSLNLNIKPECT